MITAIHGGQTRRVVIAMPEPIGAQNALSLGFHNILAFCNPCFLVGRNKELRRLLGNVNTVLLARRFDATASIDRVTKPE